MTRNRTTVSINQAAINRKVQEAAKKIQEQLNASMQQEIRRTNEEMRGRPADEIYPVLKRRMEASVPGAVMNEETLRRVAEEIEAGTLTG